jgi:hypothetical protein
MTTTKKRAVRAAITPTVERDDGQFVRTALVVEGSGAGSFDLVDKNGTLLARVNAFVYREGAKLERVIVDVIDMDKTFTTHRVCTFPTPGQRQIQETGLGPVSADFSVVGALP